MRWISGVVRGERGKLKLQVQTDSSSVCLEAVMDWRSGTQRAGSSLARDVDVDFNEFCRVDLRPYVEDLCMPWLSTAAQSGFEATAAGMRIVIPSQLMIMSLLGPAAALRGSLMAPLQANEWLTGLLSHGQAAQVKRKNWAKNWSAVERGEWIAGHRTAAAAFGSVYRYGLEGRFDLNLPKGVGTFDLRGKVSKGTLLVTHLVSLAVRPREDVGDAFKSEHGRTYFFHRRTDPAASVGKPPEAAADKRLAFSAFAKLTDNQWERAKLVLARMPNMMGVPFCEVRRSAPLRDCMDAIRFKLGAPCPWKEIKGLSSYGPAFNLYRHIVRAQLWNGIVDAIALPAPTEVVEINPAG